MVAELELNSVIPPPDTIEEDKENPVRVQYLLHLPFTLRSTQNVKYAKSSRSKLREGAVSVQSLKSDGQPLHDVDSKVPGLNLLVNDRKRLITPSQSGKRFTSLLEW